MTKARRRAFGRCHEGTAGSAADTLEWGAGVRRGAHDGDVSRLLARLAWRKSFWDDEAHLTRPELLGANGLWRICYHLAMAIGEFEAALKLAPGSAEMHHDLGAELANAGRLHEAVEHFEQAVRLQPDYESARQNLARARAELIGRR